MIIVRPFIQILRDNGSLCFNKSQCWGAETFYGEPEPEIAKKIIGSWSR